MRTRSEELMSRSQRFAQLTETPAFLRTTGFQPKESIRFVEQRKKFFQAFVRKLGENMAHEQEIFFSRSKTSLNRAVRKLLADLTSCELNGTS